jgi:hypothetical protein
MTLWQSKKGDLYLGLMRVRYTLFATCDTWPRGELSSTCALYETEKMHTTSPKSIGSHSSSQHTSSWPRCVPVPLQAWPLQASPLSFTVNWSPRNKTTSISTLRLSSRGGHSWCTGQWLCHQISTFKILHSNQSPDHSTRKYWRLANRRCHQLVYGCNRMGYLNQNSWK